MIYIMAKNNELEDTNGAFLAKNKAKLAGEADLELKLLQCFWYLLMRRKNCSSDYFYRLRVKKVL